MTEEPKTKSLITGRRFVIGALLVIVFGQLGYVLGLRYYEPFAQALRAWQPIVFLLSVGLGLAGLFILRNVVGVHYLIRGLFFLLMFVPLANLIPLLVLYIRSSSRLRQAG